MFQMFILLGTNCFTQNNKIIPNIITINIFMPNIFLKCNELSIPSKHGNLLWGNGELIYYESNTLITYLSSIKKFMPNIFLKQ